MTDPLVAIEVEGQRAWYASFAGASPGLRLEHAGGGQAILTPARPERSLVNALVYRDPDAVSLPELAAFFAPVQAWCVWVQPGHDQLAARCAAAGMVRDATPMLMGATLDELDLAPRDVGADVEEAIDWAEIARLNDAAYGLPPEHFAPVMRGLSPRGYRVAIARRESTALAIAAALLHESNAEVVFVATLAEARRQGLSGECTRAVLRQAARAGATTTTLEASQAGESVYTRIGYRSFGRYAMYEARDSVATS